MFLLLYFQLAFFCVTTTKKGPPHYLLFLPSLDHKVQDMGI